MSKEQAFERALAAKGLTLGAEDKAAALAVFAYLELCRALLGAHAPR